MRTRAPFPRPVRFYNRSRGVNKYYRVRFQTTSPVFTAVSFAFFCIARACVRVSNTVSPLRPSLRRRTKSNSTRSYVTGKVAIFDGFELSPSRERFSPSTHLSLTLRAVDRLLLLLLLLVESIATENTRTSRRSTYTVRMRSGWILVVNLVRPTGFRTNRSEIRSPCPAHAACSNRARNVFSVRVSANISYGPP